MDAVDVVPRRIGASIHRENEKDRSRAFLESRGVVDLKKKSVPELVLLAFENRILSHDQFLPKDLIEIRKRLALYDTAKKLFKILFGMIRHNSVPLSASTEPFHRFANSASGFSGLDCCFQRGVASKRMIKSSTLFGGRVLLKSRALPARVPSRAAFVLPLSAADRVHVSDRV